MANKDIRTLYANTLISVVGESSDTIMTPAGSKAQTESFKADNATVATGTNDIKYVTSKGIRDNYLPKIGGSVAGAVSIGSANSPATELEVFDSNGDQVSRIQLRPTATHTAQFGSTTANVFLDAGNSKAITFYTSGVGRFVIAADGAMNFTTRPTVNNVPIWDGNNFNPANYMPITGVQASVSFADVTASRGDGTGVIYFGGLGSTHYLYWNGTDYVLPNGNVWAPNGNISAMSGFFTNDIYANRMRTSIYDLFNNNAAANRKTGRWNLQNAGFSNYEVLNDAYSSVLYTPISINHADGKVRITNAAATSPFMVEAQNSTEGGEIVLQKAPTGNTLAGDVIFDNAGNQVRIFESGGSYRGAYLDITTTAGGATSRIWHEGILANPIQEAPNDNSTYARRNNVWVRSVGGAIVSDTAPASPEPGQKWFNSATGDEYIWYVDVDNGQWVQTSTEGVADAPYDGKNYVRNNGVWYRHGRYSDNFIINSWMLFNQRGASYIDSNVTGYPVDRWYVGNGGSATGVFRTAQITTMTPGGSSSRIRSTVTATNASPSAAFYYIIGQPIEGFTSMKAAFGTGGARQLVVRYGVNCSVAGTYSVSLRNSALNRTWLGSFTIAAGEVSTDVVKTLVIPGDTTGTWLYDNGIGMSLNIALGGGSNLVGTSGWQAGNKFIGPVQTNLLATNGATFDLFDVGVYVDYDLTGVPPEYKSPVFGDELRLCQRYYCNGSTYHYFPAPNNTFADSYRNNFPVTMRAVPSWSYATITSSSLYATNVALITTNHCDMIDTAAANTNIAHQYNWVANAEF